MSYSIIEHGRESFMQFMLANPDAVRLDEIIITKVTKGLVFTTATRAVRYWFIYNMDWAISELIVEHWYRSDITSAFKVQIFGLHAYLELRTSQNTELISTLSRRITQQ